MKREELRFPFGGSSLGRVKQCRGSARMAARAPRGLQRSKPAEEGVELHIPAIKWFVSREEPVELLEKFSDEQQWAVRFAVQKAFAMAEKIFGSPFGWTSEEEVELPFGVIDDFGHADVLAISLDGKTGFIPDFKFGRVPVAVAEENMQVRHYVVGAARKHHLKVIWTALIQPRVDEALRVNGPVMYTEADVNAAEAEIDTILRESQEDNAPLSPSPEACVYCPARAFCIAAQQNAEKFALQVIEPNFILETPEAMARFLDVAKPFMNAVQDRIKKINEFGKGGGEVPGYVWQDGRLMREVTDTVKAFDALSSLLTDVEFARQCKVSPSDLEEAVYVKFKETPQKMTRKKVTEVVENALMEVGAMDANRAEGYLRRKAT